MAYVTLTLNHLKNVSVQKGDELYFVPTGSGVFSTGNFNVDTSNILYLGPIISITTQQEVGDLTNNEAVNYGKHVLVIAVDPQLSIGAQGQIVSGLVLPTPDDFLMFSKNNKSNMSSIAGYYAELVFINNSKNYAELFSIGTEVTESSS